MKQLKFINVIDVPGVETLIQKEKWSVVNHIRRNLDNTAVCMQAVQYQSTDSLVYDNENLIAANGWQVQQILGRGKDGLVIHAHRFDDPDAKLHVTKILSKYGQQYINHSEILSLMLKNAENKPSILLDFEIAKDQIYYAADEPFQHIPLNDNWHHWAAVCCMNAWLIKNTGFVIWDFGYRSGRNFMMNSQNQTVWIDYGGAGLLRCENFGKIYQQYYRKKVELPNIMPNSLSDKQCLIHANSQFVFLQLLLNLEFWVDPDNSTADVYASVAQTKPQIADELLRVIPTILKSSVTKDLYKNFHNQDCTDNITWIQLGKYFDCYRKS